MPMLVINACQKHQNLSVYAAETVIQFFCSTSCFSKTLLSVIKWNMEQ